MALPPPPSRAPQTSQRNHELRHVFERTWDHHYFGLCFLTESRQHVIKMLASVRRVNYHRVRGNNACLHGTDSPAKLAGWVIQQYGRKRYYLPAELPPTSNRPVYATERGLVPNAQQTNFRSETPDAYASYFHDHITKSLRPFLQSHP